MVLGYGPLKEEVVVLIMDTELLLITVVMFTLQVIFTHPGQFILAQQQFLATHMMMHISLK